MQQRWIHPLFKPSQQSSRQLPLFSCAKRFTPRFHNQSEIVSNVALNRIGNVAAFGKPESSSFFDTLATNRLALLACSALLTVVSVIFIFVAQTKYSGITYITALDFADFSVPDFKPIDKASFLARFSAEKKLDTVNQIKYVAQLIKNARRPSEEAKKLAFLIVAESMQAGYDPLFIAALIKSESTFNRHAVSKVGATGLMQIMPGTGAFTSKLSKLEWHGTSRLRDPEYNLRLGIAYLKYLEKSFKGNRELALIAYNWGPQNVINAVQSTRKFPQSTVKYARNIITNHGRWSADYSRNIEKFRHMDIELVS